MAKSRKPITVSGTLQPPGSPSRRVGSVAGDTPSKKLMRRAVEFHQRGNVVEAERVYRRVLDLDAAHGSARHYLALIAWDRDHNNASAIAILEETARAHPRNPTMQHNLGSVYGVQGKVSAAIAQFERAIELQPDFAEAYFNLSTYLEFKPGDVRIETMRKMLSKRGRSEQDRCFLGFALGKALDDIGEFDEAFSSYGIGNKAAGRHFDGKILSTDLEELRAVFTPEYFAERCAVGSDSEVPTFVIGMPRSGTSLLEQIVASHPLATGAGEIRDIKAINDTLRQRAEDLFDHHAKMFTHLPYLPPEAFRGMAGTYLRRLSDYSEADTQRVVNKTPNNFMHVGLIATLFPRAKILHAVRDPVDTGLSCYFQNFRVQQSFSFSLAHIVEYTRFYRGCMQHWQATAPVRIMDVPYERIAGGDQGLVRDVIEFCGLDWDDACLSPQSTDRSVRTASSWQVRQPVYSSSVQRWRNYERHVSPLLALRCRS